VRPPWRTFCLASNPANTPYTPSTTAEIRPLQFASSMVEGAALAIHLVVSPRPQ